MTSAYHELTDQWRDAIGYLPDMTQYERIQVVAAIARQIGSPIIRGTADLLSAAAWSFIVGSCDPDVDSADIGTYRMTHLALPAGTGVVHRQFCCECMSTTTDYHTTRVVEHGRQPRSWHRCQDQAACAQRLADKRSGLIPW